MTSEPNIEHYDKGGWDALLWKMVQLGDAVVCAAPFAVPESQEIEIKRGGNFGILEDALTDLDDNVPTIRKDALRCKTGFRSKKIKDRTEFRAIKQEFNAGTIKKLNCKIKRRSEGGNFAKMKCKGLWRDFRDDKTIRCQGHNVFGDRLAFSENIGEIEEELFSDVYPENIGKCRGGHLIVPNLIRQKGLGLMRFCHDAVLGLTRPKGIPSGGINNLANPIRGLETQKCEL